MSSAVIADAVRFLAHVPNVVHCKRVPHAERDHATQKPEDLLVAILKPVLPAGGVVVDPFAGSGTAVTAAGRLGAVAWCCDADPSHLPAIERQVSLQGGLDL